MRHEFPFGAISPQGRLLRSVESTNGRVIKHEMMKCFVAL